jgi:hypothetical protein
LATESEVRLGGVCADFDRARDLQIDFERRVEFDLVVVIRKLLVREVFRLANEIACRASNMNRNDRRKANFFRRNGNARVDRKQGTRPYRRAPA